MEKSRLSHLSKNLFDVLAQSKQTCHLLKTLQCVLAALTAFMIAASDLDNKDQKKMPRFLDCNTFLRKDKREDKSWV